MVKYAKYFQLYDGNLSGWSKNRILPIPIILECMVLYILDDISIFSVKINNFSLSLSLSVSF